MAPGEENSTNRDAGVNPPPLYNRAPAPAPAPAPAASSPRVAERRFRISLPWPLRAAFGAAAQAESSNPTNDDVPPSGANNNDHDASGGGPQTQSGYDDLD